MEYVGIFVSFVGGGTELKVLLGNDFAAIYNTRK
jgi:hypothetical protein